MLFDKAALVWLYCYSILTFITKTKIEMQGLH